MEDSTAAIARDRILTLLAEATDPLAVRTLVKTLERVAPNRSHDAILRENFADLLAAMERGLQDLRRRMDLIEERLPKRR